MANTSDAGEGTQGADGAQLCHRCGRMLRPGAGNWWQVSIEAVVDPSPLELTVEDLLPDTQDQVASILDDIASSSEQELMDQVHRRLTLELCSACFARWIEDPAP